VVLLPPDRQDSGSATGGGVPFLNGLFFIWAASGTRPGWHMTGAGPGATRAVSTHHLHVACMCTPTGSSGLAGKSRELAGKTLAQEGTWSTNTYLTRPARRIVACRQSQAGPTAHGPAIITVAKSPQHRVPGATGGSGPARSRSSPEGSSERSGHTAELALQPAHIPHQSLTGGSRATSASAAAACGTPRSRSMFVAVLGLALTTSEPRTLYLEYTTKIFGHGSWENWFVGVPLILAFALSVLNAIMGVGRSLYQAAEDGHLQWGHLPACAGALGATSSTGTCARTSSGRSGCPPCASGPHRPCSSSGWPPTSSAAGAH
jgi:hypothetical protein